MSASSLTKRVRVEQRVEPSLNRLLLDLEQRGRLVVEQLTRLGYRAVHVESQ